MGEPREETPAFIREALIDAVTAARDVPVAPRGCRSCARRSRAGSQRRFGVALDPGTEIIPTLGSKEAIFGLAQRVRRRVRRRVPSPAYPVYERGARSPASACSSCRCSRPTAGCPTSTRRRTWDRVALLWLNYPNNPTGATAPLEFYEAAAALARRARLRARQRRGLLRALLRRRAARLRAAGRATARTCSCSTRSPSAPRCPATAPGFVAGDPELIAALKRYRPNVGVAPLEIIQRAAVAAWGDEAHVDEVRDALPGQARRHAACARGAAGCATPAATRRSSSGSTRARTPRRWPPHGSRRA